MVTECRLKKVRVCFRSLLYACRVGDVEKVVYILGSFFIFWHFVHLNIIIYIYSSSIPVDDSLQRLYIGSLYLWVTPKIYTKF